MNSLDLSIYFGEALALNFMKTDQELINLGIKPDNLKAVVNYVMENYPDDSEKLLQIPAVALLTKMGEISRIPSVVDKIAIVNNISKSVCVKA